MQQPSFQPSSQTVQFKAPSTLQEALQLQSMQQQPMQQQPTQPQQSRPPTPYHLLQQEDQKFWQQQQPQKQHLQQQEQDPVRRASPYDFQQQQPIRGHNLYEMQQERQQQPLGMDRSGATSPASVGYGASSMVTPSGMSYSRHSPRPSSPYQQQQGNALHLDQQSAAPTSMPSARAPTPSLFQSLIAPPAPTSMQPTGPSPITSLHDIQNQQQSPAQHQQNLTLTTQGALPPRSSTRRQSFGYDGSAAGEENRMPGAPYQGLANGYGPPKSDHGQTQSRPPQPPGPIGPEMSMDVAADAHLPQTLQRDPLMADETGYSEEDNRIQALRDMELYREGLPIIFRVAILLLFKMKFNLGTNAKIVHIIQQEAAGRPQCLCSTANHRSPRRRWPDWGWGTAVGEIFLS